MVFARERQTRDCRDTSPEPELTSGGLQAVAGGGHLPYATRLFQRGSRPVPATFDAPGTGGSGLSLKRICSWLPPLAHLRARAGWVKSEGTQVCSSRNSRRIPARLGASAASYGCEAD
jgi:hypothetical protein